MPGPIDERPVSLGEILQAAEAHDIGGFVDRLAQQQNWEAIAFLFKVAQRPQGQSRLAIADLTAAAQAFRDRAKLTRAGRREERGPDPDLRDARLTAAEALLLLAHRPPDGEADRRALRLGAGLLFDAGEHQRAAPLFEELGEDARAADAFAALGDIDKMEEALGRVDARQRARLTAVDAMRRFEALLGAGERVAAVRAVAAIPEGTAEAASAHQLARRLDGRLCRGRGVTLRLPDGSTARFAALPALLGRDPAVEVPLRDPGVSRRHAIVRREGGDVVVEDAGSRAGVRLHGARVAAPIPLRGEGELALGPSCRLHYRAAGDGALVLRGEAGLDRALVAVLGDAAPALALARALPAATGVWFAFDNDVARLGRAPEIAVRVDGQLIGGGCDLLHGDMVEIRPTGHPPDQPPLRIEVC